MRKHPANRAVNSVEGKAMPPMEIKNIISQNRNANATGIS
jgi:hypothetical protein